MTEIDGYEVLGLGLYFEDLPVGPQIPHHWPDAD